MSQAKNQPKKEMVQTQRFHIGVIPDGNRRWALEKKLPPWEGHKLGSEKMEMFLKWAVKNPQINEVSVYALSEENFKRHPEELSALYNIYYDGLKKLMNEGLVHDEQIHVNFVSTRGEKIPGNLKGVLREVKHETKLYGNKVLNILIGYTGQSEILRAVSNPMNRVKNLLFGLNEKDLEKALGVKKPCDFIIRTGSEEEKREAKSGFLLWQSAYAEYYYIPKFFPEVEESDLNTAWEYFLNTRRMKGK